MPRGGVSMFCTKCGQEQTSESARFCARCGFKFNGGDEPLTKRFLMMAMYLVITIFAIIGWGSITAGPGYMQVRVLITLISATAFYLLFFNDLVRAFRRLFAQNSQQVNPIAPASEPSAFRRSQRNTMPSVESHRINTAEIVPPPSVTEQTTILLDKNR